MQMPKTATRHNGAFLKRNVAYTKTCGPITHRQG